jgi:hypothetical protein
MSAQELSVSSIHPTPTEEEAVAITAALEFGWPRAVISEPTNTRPSTSWRFSGRWWASHGTLRRARPGL